MSDRDMNEQLVKYLTDVHSIEEQALVQMRSAPEIAGDGRLAEAFRAHLTETEGHERRVAELLRSHDAKPSKLKDVAGEVTGKAFALFARFQPDTPGKLVTHAYSYEHMEAAAYELLEGVAERAGDEEVEGVAREIGDEERAMGHRLEGLLDVAVDASLRQLDPDDLKAQVVRYLADAHAIEHQAVGLLKRGIDVAGPAVLRRALEEHLQETVLHRRMVEERLREYDAQPSKVKDAALRLGALNWGAFFAAQPDTPAKLAGFAYAFEHLEIAAYEQLRLVAERAGDNDTIALVGRILPQERSASEKVHTLFPAALDESLHELGVAV